MKKTLTLALLFYAFVVAFCGCKTNHTAQTLNYSITTLKSTIYKGVNGDYIVLSPYNPDEQDDIHLSLN